ncbi:hypothetical protein WN944_026437 [Citrus x changshan-huyou]|uniref:Uncharacterized protein n=1 Tax=Citrus x changshan-huyou TaxID=2935761 RepID=A0AAP0LS08_9ROSI
MATYLVCRGLQIVDFVVGFQDGWEMARKLGDGEHPDSGWVTTVIF